MQNCHDTFLSSTTITTTTTIENSKKKSTQCTVPNSDDGFDQFNQISLQTFDKIKFTFLKTDYCVLIHFLN